MVFQNGALFDSLTVRENVAYALRERGDLTERQIYDKANELLKMVGVESVRDRLPADISTGWKRSVAIGRALAEMPEAVLYDEPTTMVDPFMSHRLTELIGTLKIRLKLTSVVVTHDTRLAEKLADRVLFLDQGRIAFVGTTEEMMSSSQPLVQEFLALDQSDLPVLEKTGTETST
jgi:phospholipid/cholesterol/gamma-HCH transport system ATP-binding protein